MNKEAQAKNGFKTFIVTLSVSLVIFGAIYYLITDSSSNIDIESEDPVAYEVKGAKTESDSESVFKEISEKPTHANPAVLQAADTTSNDTTTNTTTTTSTDETEEATVPDTGSETLLGTILTLGFFGAAVFMIIAGPRKLALAEFENKITKDL